MTDLEQGRAELFRLAEALRRLQDQHSDRVKSLAGATYAAQEKREAAIRDGNLGGQRLKGRELFEAEARVEQLDKLVASDARDVDTARRMYTEAKANLDILEAESRREHNAAELTRLAARSEEMEQALRVAAYNLLAKWNDDLTVRRAMADLDGPEVPYEHLGDWLRANGIEVDKPAALQPVGAFSPTPGYSPLSGFDGRIPSAIG